MKNSYHTFRTKKKISVPDHYLFLDTETLITKGKERDVQTLKLGWAIYWNRETNEKEELYFEDANTFWDYVDDLDYKKLILYAHNTEFDFKIVDGYRQLLLHRGWEISNLYIQGTVFIMNLTKGKKMLCIWDTMNYIPFSLKKLGDSIGLKKTDIDFDTCSMEELSKYCLNDVEIISLFIEKLLEFLTTYDLTGLRSTAGSTALSCFRRKFYSADELIYIHAHESTIKLERDSYKGGITDCFKVGTNIKEKLYKIDINSMYPYIMRTFESPVKLLYYRKNVEVKDLISSIKKFHVIADVTIYLPKDKAYILSVQKVAGQTKSVFMKGKFRTSLTTPELQYVIDNGKIVKIHQMAVYKKRFIFREYVDFFYNKRLEFKDNKAFNLFCKLMLNTLYGKFGQKAQDIELLRDDLTFDVAKYQIIEAKKEYTLIHLGNKLFKQEKTEENAYDGFVAISSLITGYSRSYLIELILKAKRENVYYCDTDSLVLNKEGYDNLKEYIHPSKLGLLKLEETSTDSSFIRPKFYEFNGVLKCKGVRKGALTISDDKDEWVVQQDQFIRFKTAIKEGSIDRQEVKHITKHMSKMYDKGIVLEDGSIEPYDKYTLPKREKNENKRKG